MMEFLLDLLPLGEVAMKAHEDRFVRSPLGMFFLRADGRTAVRITPDEAVAFRSSASAQLGKLEAARSAVTFGRRLRWFFIAIGGLILLPFLPMIASLSVTSVFSLAIFLIFTGPLLYAVVRFWLASRRLGQEIEAALATRPSIDVAAISRFIRRNPFRTALPWVVMVAVSVPIGLRLPGWIGVVSANDPASYVTQFVVDIIAALSIFLIVLLTVYYDRYQRPQGRA